MYEVSFCLTFRPYIDQTYDDSVNRAKSCDANVIRIRSTHGRQSRCDDDLHAETAIDQHGGELV
jgi:hypothetical protein